VADLCRLGVKADRIVDKDGQDVPSLGRFSAFTSAAHLY